MVKKFLRTSLLFFTLSRAGFFAQSFAEDVGIAQEGSEAENSGPSDEPTQGENTPPPDDQEVTTIYVDENGEERVDEGTQEEVVEEEAIEEVVSNNSKPIYIDQESSITITDLDEGTSELNDPNAQVTITHIETDSGDITTTLQTQGTPDVEIDIKEKVDITKLIGPGGEFLFGEALSPQEKEELLRARKNATAKNEDRELLWKDKSISIGSTSIELSPGETIATSVLNNLSQDNKNEVMGTTTPQVDTVLEEVDVITQDNEDPIDLVPTEDTITDSSNTQPDILDQITAEVEDLLPQDDDTESEVTTAIPQPEEIAPQEQIIDEIVNSENEVLLDEKETPFGQLIDSITETLSLDNNTSDNLDKVNSITEVLPVEDLGLSENPASLAQPHVQFQPETLIASLYENTISLDDIALEQDITIGAEFDGIVLDALSLGKEDDYLIFSHPIAITFSVPNEPDGRQLEVLTLHDGDTEFNSYGLTANPFATCAPDGSSSEPSNVGIVENETLTMYTCAASTFVVTFVGGQSPENFVDGTFIDETITVTTADVYTGLVIGDIRIVVDFWSIDGTDPFNPGTGDSNSQEKYMRLRSPQGTTVMLLASGAYTDPSNASRVTVAFDSAAGQGITGLPTSGSFQPSDSLSAFYGEDPVGNRSFRYGDTTEGDGLILFDVSLELVDTICGDGLLIGLEEACDDGNNNNLDGCSSTCELEEGRECVGTAPSVCDLIIPGLEFHIDGTTLSSSVFQDISGNGKHGTGYNSVTTGSINGEEYMCFNGTNSYVEITNNSMISGYPFTVSARVQSNDVSSVRGVVSLARSNAANVMYNIEHNGNGKARARAQNTTARYAASVTTLNTTDRYLLTAVFNGTSDRDIYVNGEFERNNTATASFNTLVNRWNIGRLADSSPSNYFDGCIDEVRVYNRALDTGEIYNLYANPTALTTETVYHSSPLLTGVAEGYLDRISVVIDGSSYSGINNADGTRYLPADIVTPALQTGAHTTTLIVTNPYNHTNVYTSSFTYIDPTIYVDQEVIFSTGTITIIVPENTEIDIETGDIITGAEQLEIISLPIEPEEALAGVEEKFEFGGTGNYLVFSGPVIIEYDAPFPEGTEIVTNVMHAGDTEFNTFGLATDPLVTCNEDGSSSMDNNITYVSGGKATFYTCGASTFTITYVGGPTTGNFVDGSYTGKTITVSTGDVYTGFTIKAIDLLVDFWSIDGTNPSSPGTGTANSSEIWMSITSPVGTTRTLLASGTYTNPAYAPRVEVTFDDSAPVAPAGLPATGTFLPYESLDVFSGENPIGDRTFWFGDTTTGDGLILYDASLQLSDHAEFCSDPIQTSFRVVGTQNDRVGQYDLATPGVLTSVVYDTGLSITLQEATPQDVFFSDDGRWMYQMGNGTDAVFQYAVETPREIDTALSLAATISQDTSTEGSFFSPDGTKMYTVGQGRDRVYEYSLGVPRNLKSVTFVRSGSVAAQETVPAGVAFNASGTKMYVLGSNGDDINQYSLPTAWSISGFTYDGATFNKSVAAQESVPTGFYFNADGTRMWVIGSNGDDINPYTLTGAWEVRTAVYDGAGENKVVSSQDTTPADLSFSDDGLRLYVVGSTNDAVYEYLLTGARSVKTATFNRTFKVVTQESVPTNINFNASGTQMYIAGSNIDRQNSYYLTGAWDLETVVQPRYLNSAQETGGTSLFFNTTGTKMYIAGIGTRRVYQYTISPPWMISGAVYDNVSFFLGTQDTAPQSVYIRPDGTKMYMVGTTNDRVHQYTLTGAWNMATATYDALSGSVTSQDGTPNEVHFSPDGTRMYMVGSTNDRVYQYIFTGAWDIRTMTYNTIFTGVATQENAPMGLFFAYPDICDGLDNDCDGLVDEGSVTIEYFLDADGDGQGTSGSTIDMCTLPDNYVTNNYDCNDAANSVYSGATEVCDELDNNCDGLIDEGVVTTFYIDADDDGQGSATGTARSVVDGGNAHTCALSPSDLVWCRGDDSQQQLGNGSSDTTAINTPVQVVTLTGIQDVSAGNSGVHSCVLKLDGTARCRGGDGEQQLGDGNGDTTSEHTPAQVALLTGIQQLSVGTTHACAIIENETLRCRGDDGNQQLGNGNADTTDRQTPIQVVNLTGVQNVAAGSYFTCATIENGTVRCRGYDGQQQLGDGNVDTTNENTPAQVANLTGVQSITAGNQHACAVIANGTARCRGQDSSQQLGNGNADTTARQTPVQVVNLTGIQSITAGQSHACALVANGAIWCRGEDGSQELGNGNADTTDRQTPVLATGMAVSTFVEAGGLHTCGLKSNGPVRCRGRDLEQQLGNGSGDTTARQTPIQVVNLTGVGILLSCNVTETGYSLNAYDCNDGANAVYSGATEVCDELDNDCDASIDEGVQTTFYQDSDSDGQGTGAVTTGACAAPSGYTGNTRDCNDSDASIYSGATEICDVLDNDCDASIDEGVQTTFYQDSDSDGQGTGAVTTGACAAPSGYTGNTRDCNDSDITIYSGATEITGDNINQSCDGTEICYLDFDDDTWRPTSTGFVASADIDCNDSGEAVYTDPIGDCDDGSGTIYSGAAEITGDNIDQSCDGQEICYLDGDNDGYRTGATYTSADADCDDLGEALATDPIGDCDDGDGTVYSGATEICDEQDNDCDGDIDEGFYSVIFYQDSDGDGYGTSAVTTGINCLDSIPLTGSCAEGLVGYWPFDTGALDFSTYGNHGTTGGNTHFTATGRIASGATFDGNNDNVQIADTGSLDLTTGLTIDMWINSTDPASGFPFNKQGSGNFGKYSVYRGNDGSYSCTINENASAVTILGGDIPNGTRGHVLCTYDGEEFNMYMDGVFYTGKVYTGVIGASASTLRMGEYLTFDYAGRLDEVKLYNRALGAREVANSYDYGSICPDGYAMVIGDCDDTNSAMYTGATEVCDFLDNDCNGLVDDGIICGTVSISGAATFNITGVTTLGVSQNIQRTISGYFSVIDTLGSNSGYYTTLSLSNLSGSANSFANSIVQRRGTGLALITGDANTGVVIANDFTGFVVASGTNTFIKRDVGPNGGKTGIYGAYIDLSITIPAFAAVDIYTGVIYYTLYEN